MTKRTTHFAVTTAMLTLVIECQLQTQVNVREVLIVTAVWSANKAECDHVSLVTPNTGVPIAPWWACRRAFRVEGPGAGYSGVIVTQCNSMGTLAHGIGAALIGPVTN